MRFPNQILLIEGGRALEMVQEHIAEATRVRKQNQEIAKELGVEEIWTDKANGKFSGAVFKGEIHPEFTKPKRHDKPSYPKKGSAWDKRIKALIGYRCQEEWISEEFKIPISLSYSRGGKWCGFTHIGMPLMACGFLYIGKDGPYAMWVPDVPAYVSEVDTSWRGEVDEPARSFKFDIPGTRPISRDEWDLMALQYKVAKQREAGVVA